MDGSLSHPDLIPRIVQVRKENKQRIIGILMERIDREVKSTSYYFEPNLSEEQEA